MSDSVKETLWNLKSIQRGTLITAAVLLVGSLFFKSIKLTLGVFAGGFFAFINFVILQRIVITITSATSEKKILVGSLSLLKFILLAIAIFVLIYSQKVDPIGLIIGLSSVVIVLTFLKLVKFFGY